MSDCYIRSLSSSQWRFPNSLFLQSSFVFASSASKYAFGHVPAGWLVVKGYSLQFSQQGSWFPAKGFHRASEP
jgi:hypothetical protein